MRLKPDTLNLFMAVPTIYGMMKVVCTDKSSQADRRLRENARVAAKSRQRIVLQV